MIAARHPRVRPRTLLLAGAGAWIARWALFEVAVRVASRLPRRPADPDAPRRPGHMPGPLDR